MPCLITPASSFTERFFEVESTYTEAVLAPGVPGATIGVKRIDPAAVTPVGIFANVAMTEPVPEAVTSPVNAVIPVPPEPQAAPAVVALPDASIFRQSFVAGAAPA